MPRLSDGKVEKTISDVMICGGPNTFHFRSCKGQVETAVHEFVDTVDGMQKSVIPPFVYM